MMGVNVIIIQNLSNEDTEKIRNDLEQGILATVELWHPYWYPLYPVKKDIPVIAFDSDFIANKTNIEKVVNILIHHNVSYVIELQELNNARKITGKIKEYFEEEDDDGIIFPYMSECYWFDFSKEWMIYSSHEATIAFAGEWLVREIKAEIIGYMEHEIK